MDIRMKATVMKMRQDGSTVTSKKKESRMSRDEKLVEVFDDIAHAINRLGLNGAATEMGAIEALSFEVKEGMQAIATSLDGLAAAIRNHGDEHED